MSFEFKSFNVCGPSKGFVPELYFRTGFACLAFYIIDVIRPHGRRGYAMADQVHCIQSVCPTLSYVRLQARHLAWRAGKQHLPPFAQVGLYLGKYASQIALHIF